MNNSYQINKNLFDTWNNLPLTQENVNDTYKQSFLKTKIECNRLIYALPNEEKSRVQEIIAFKNFDINYQLKFNKKTALHYAVLNQKYIEILLSRDDINVNIQDNKGKTAFLLSCHCVNAFNTIKYKKTFQLLLNDPRVNINIPDHNKNTPLSIFLSFKCASLDVLKEYLEHPRVKVWTSQYYQFILNFLNISPTLPYSLQIYNKKCEYIKKAIKREIILCLISPRCIPRLCGECICLLPPELVRLMVHFL